MSDLISIRMIEPKDQTWAKNIISEHFGSALVVSRGKLHDSQTLPAILAIRGNERIGLLHYHIENRQCEIVTIISLNTGEGIGRKLLETVKAIARKADCERIWLITTNDNLSAQHFYQHVGGIQVAIFEDAIQKARTLKPEIPEFGENGIPIRDEIEFEWNLGGKK